MDYAKTAATARRLIDKYGRDIVLYKLDGAAADPAKPWRGAGTPTKIDPVATKAIFVVPNTSIPTESRGLGFDWIDQELLKRARHVCVIAAEGLPELEGYHVATDSGKDWHMIWGQCLQPGPTRLIYVFGFAQ